MSHVACSDAACAGVFASMLDELGVDVDTGNAKRLYELYDLFETLFQGNGVDLTASTDVWSEGCLCRHPGVGDVLGRVGGVLVNRQDKFWRSGASLEHRAMFLL